jgi:O-acetyl-ADP-ribose deacetylase (regulator of RNase III)
MIKGNLIDLAEQGHFNVIVHGCNCFHTMGSGIAKEIKARYPRAYRADTDFTVKGDINKLGHYSWAIVAEPNKHEFIILNAYTQYRYGKDGTHVDYDAIQRVFETIAKNFGDKVIGYPKIGAGLAGGDWNTIETIINKKLQGITHHLVVL